jgi:hypothetical protein
MAQGKYVWILSPDDRLRSPDVVERYVSFMEANSQVGFVFCPAHLIVGGKDLGVSKYTLYSSQDQILDSRQLVKDIVADKFHLVAASVMIRKECYERITFFPEDMPHRGDSYVWAAIAMRYQVGYFAAAMVDYREHGESMIAFLSRDNMKRMIEDDIAVPWRVKAIAEQKGDDYVVDHCRKQAIVLAYKKTLVGLESRGYPYKLSLEEIESSLIKWEAEPNERSRIRKALASHLYWVSMAELCRGHPSKASDFFRMSVKLQPTLRFHPPLGQLMRRPDLKDRVPSVMGEVAAKLFGHAAWRQ